MFSGTFLCLLNEARLKRGVDTFCPPDAPPGAKDAENDSWWLRAVLQECERQARSCILRCSQSRDDEQTWHDLREASSCAAMNASSEHDQAIEAAAKAGFDINLIECNLALPFEERWRQHNLALTMALELQQARLERDAKLRSTPALSR